MFNNEVIDAANGKIEADLLLKNCKIIDVFTSSIFEGEIAIYRGVIVGINDNIKAKNEIDLKGMFVAPGFFDSHIHIESTLLTPYEFSKLVVTKGTTSVVADPHEIANVHGYEGIRFMLTTSRNLPVNIFFMIPSCVPATELDRSGAYLYASDMFPFIKEENVLGLAEVMDYVQVVNRDPRIMDKIALFSDKVIDGHAPMLTGKTLSAYLTAGIGSDHEATNFNEAMEKLRKGMHIIIREGSTAKDLDALYKIVSEKTKSRLMVCTDDRHPDDLYYEGHIDHILRRLINKGVDPITAIQMATINPATYFKLKRIGGIAPGYYADLVVFSDLKKIDVKKVFKNGILVVEDGELKIDIKKYDYELKDSVNIKWLSEEDFKIIDKGKKVRIIKTKQHSLLTEQIIDYVPSENGYLKSDIEKDYLKLFVIERHFGSGKIGKAFLNGIGLKKGAIGSTISHDSHNMIIAGVDDISIFKAAKHLNKIGGGLVITEGDNIIADLPLPVAGLMTDQPYMQVIEKMKIFEKLFKNLNLKVENPFMSLSFIALPVIPELKLTVNGLVDVNKFEFVSLYVD